MTQPPILNISHFHTTQKTPVYFVRTPELPMLDIQLVFQAGSARDGEKLGLADLTNSLLDEGTQHLSADEIAEQFDAVGANYSAGVHRDSASLSLRTLTNPKFLKSALNTFKQVLSTPVFSDTACERARKWMITALEEDLQQPSVLAENAFYAALYPNHPYGHPTSGNLASVRSLTREDVIDFYLRHYTAQNVLVTMVGDVSIEQAQQITEDLVSGLPKGVSLPPLPLANNVAAFNQTIAFPSQQTTVYLGQVGIARQEADYFSLLLGNHILGGGGMVSRLFHEIREKKGWVYGIYSTFSPLLLGRGPFYIKLQTRHTEAQNALTMTKEMLHSFVEKGPTPAELEAAKKNLIGGFALDLAGNANILSQLLRIGFYQLPLDYLETYRDKIAAVSAEEIRTAFQKHLKMEQLVEVKVGG